MLSLWLLLAFGAGALAYGLIEDSGSDDNDETPTDDGSTVLVEDGESYVGTDGDDLFTPAPNQTGGIEVNIDAGAGNDLLLFDTGAATGLSGGSLDGGPGNDVLRAQGDLTSLIGGEGDDTIEANVFGSTIEGGAGGDDITVVSNAGDLSLVDAGDGNDAIDARGSENISVLGGEGDDTIQTDGQVTVGTGYVIAADGGAGDDVLRHAVETFPPDIFMDPAQAPAELTGGLGADQFEIVIGGGGGVFSESPDDPDVVDLLAVSVTDFEQGTDTLVVDVTDPGPAYEATEAQLIEDAAAGTTLLQVLLEADTLPNQNIQIQIGATGLTFDDIAFVGGTPTLIP